MKSIKFFETLQITCIWSKNFHCYKRNTALKWNCFFLSSVSHCVSYTFLAFFVVFYVVSYVFIILIYFFDEISNFCNRILTNNKYELVIRNRKSRFFDPASCWAINSVQKKEYSYFRKCGWPKKSSPGRPQIYFFNRFSGDILFSSFYILVFFCFVFFACLFFFLKLRIYILIHIRLCRRVSD